MLQTDQQFPAVGSLTKGVLVNPDGSVDVYFGPKPPTGKEANWVQTIPGQLLRLYSPLEPWFNKTWRPGELNRCSGQGQSTSAFGTTETSHHVRSSSVVGSKADIQVRVRKSRLISDNRPISLLTLPTHPHFVRVSALRAFSGFPIGSVSVGNHSQPATVLCVRKWLRIHFALYRRSDPESRASNGFEYIGSEEPLSWSGPAVR